MAFSIARKIISKSTNSRLLARSYVFVKPTVIDNHYHHLPLISSCFPTTTASLRSITTTNNPGHGVASSPPPSSSSSTIRSFRSQNTVEDRFNDGTLLTGPLVPEYDPGRWLCYLDTQGVEFDSGKNLLAYYVNTLASVVGSVEEAKKKIYLVSWKCYKCCFGAHIDETTKNKLKELPNVTAVSKDYYADVRDKSPTAQSPIKIVPLNWNNRLLSMDDYHKSSECKQGDSCHWLVKIKRPDGGFYSVEEAIEWCIQFLAEFVGREEAKTRIYIIWCDDSFGFGAEIDEGVLKQVQAQPDVQVLEDHAFDVQRKDLGVLVCTLPDGTPGLVYWPVDDLLNSDDEESDLNIS